MCVSRSQNLRWWRGESLDMSVLGRGSEVPKGSAPWEGGSARPAHRVHGSERFPLMDGAGWESGAAACPWVAGCSLPRTASGALPALGSPPFLAPGRPLLPDTV